MALQHRRLPIMAQAQAFSPQQAGFSWCRKCPACLLLKLVHRR
jgi:hypothetical protein